MILVQVSCHSRFGVLAAVSIAAAQARHSRIVFMLHAKSQTMVDLRRELSFQRLSRIAHTRFPRVCRTEAHRHSYISPLP